MSTIALPTYTIGEGASSTLQSILKDMPVAIVSGEKSWAAAKPHLPEFSICAHHRYGAKCTPAAIEAAAKTAKAAGAHAILGIGGGKALDVAKAAAEMLSLPAYTLPTIAATCAAITKLSVVYREDGAFDAFWFHKTPPAYAVLDTSILVNAPPRYLRAGLADTLAKGIEPPFAARGDEDANYASRLGLSISPMCLEPILACGTKAYQDNLGGKPSPAFTESLQGIIISTGLVSLLVDEGYNCAVAHSVCYGLDAIEGVADRALHGELVGYGCLVQLAIDSAATHSKAAAALLPRVRGFLQSLDIPVTLAGNGLSCDKETLAPMIQVTLSSPDMRKIPYVITESMLFEAMEAVEKM